MLKSVVKINELTAIGLSFIHFYFVTLGGSTDTWCHRKRTASAHWTDEYY